VTLRALPVLGQHGVTDTPYIGFNSLVAMPSPGYPIYAGADGNIYAPNDAALRGQSLRSQYGGALDFMTANGAQLSELAGFVDAGGYSHTFYIGGYSGYLFEYYRVPNQTTWSTNQLGKPSF
jgi:hypothetical protein